MTLFHRPTAALLLSLGFAAPAQPSNPASKEKSEISQDISIKAAKAKGPAISLPAPRPDETVVDEVLHSLTLYKSDFPVTPNLQVPGGPKRLRNPFPDPPYLVFSPRAVVAPYSEWTFEIFESGRIVWRMEGVGKLKKRIEWDGTRSSGENVMHVGKDYYFRFSGMNGPTPFALTSEAVSFPALAFKSYVGETRLEVANSVLFASGQSALKKDAGVYLLPVADYMRRVNLREESYRFVLYQEKPTSPKSSARMQTLRAYFSKQLVISPKRIEVEIRGWGERGDCTVCVLPAEKGESIRIED